MKARWLARLLFRVALRIAARRVPDFVIGPSRADSYMDRWYVIPRNPVLSIYLHRINKSDNDRALHDHPWPSVSVMLHGALIEIYARKIVERGHDGKPEVITATRSIGAGTIVWRGARFAHRLIMDFSEPSWTLFITGPRIRKWGFWCPHSWRYWRDFTDTGDTGRIGRGCE